MNVNDIISYVSGLDAVSLRQYKLYIVLRLCTALSISLVNFVLYMNSYIFLSFDSIYLGLGLEGQCLGLGLEGYCLGLGLGLGIYCLVNKSRL